MLKIIIQGHGGSMKELKDSELREFGQSIHDIALLIELLRKSNDQSETYKMALTDAIYTLSKQKV